VIVVDVLTPLIDYFHASQYKCYRRTHEFYSAEIKLFLIYSIVYCLGILTRVKSPGLVAGSTASLP
jgi:hypothetical protein